jgi:acyl carrier protein
MREHLAERLPEYMIPSAFVTLDALPLLPSGKVNRKALPAPDASREGSGRAYVAPRNEIEARLAEIWADVLGLERASVEENFFEMGGHSLLATQVVSRVREEFQIELPLRSIFEKPSVASLSLVVMERLAGEEIDDLLAELEGVSGAEKSATGSAHSS